MLQISSGVCPAHGQPLDTGGRCPLCSSTTFFIQGDGAFQVISPDSGNEKRDGGEKRPYTCPVCNGQGKVSKPPWVAGDQQTWTDSGINSYTCPACHGTCVLWG